VTTDLIFINSEEVSCASHASTDASRSCFLFFQKQTLAANLTCRHQKRDNSRLSLALVITPEEELQNQHHQLIVLANNRINLVVFFILLRFYYNQDSF